MLCWISSDAVREDLKRSCDSEGSSYVPRDCVRPRIANLDAVYADMYLIPGIAHQVVHDLRVWPLLTPSARHGRCTYPLCSVSFRLLSVGTHR